jgi:hypothetical protein
MTSHNPNDAEHGYCGNCHEFTDSEMGYISAVLRHVSGLSTVTMSHVTSVLRSIKSTDNTMESWRKLVEESHAKS